MDNVRKLAVVPFESQPMEPNVHHHHYTQPSKVNKIKDHASRRIMNLLKVMAKLAKIGGYDENFRILGRSGYFIEGTDISTLLNHAMSPSRVVNGENEFLELLARAGVDSDLILNENLRSRMLRQSNYTGQLEPQLRSQSDNLAIRRYEPPVVRKRRYSSEEESNEGANNKRQRVSWDYPDDGSDIE